MKIQLPIIFIVLFSPVVFSGCKAKTLQKSQESLPEQKISSSSQPKEHSKLDFDLTKMGANLVYAQVFNMMIQPEDYAGKVFRLKGNFACYKTDKGDVFAVVIADALACCQQGIEFKYNFTKNQPLQNQMIEVTGKYTVETSSDGIVRAFVVADKIDLL